jgi:molecular chaperone GrpE
MKTETRRGDGDEVGEKKQKDKKDAGNSFDDGKGCKTEVENPESAYSNESGATQFNEDLATLKRELEAEKGQTKAYFMQLQHLQADFDNYQKMVSKKNVDLVKLANERLIVSLLPLLDSFEQALCATAAATTLKNHADKNQPDDENAASPEQGHAQATYIEGFRSLYKEFLKILECNGVEQIEAVNVPFDPYQHEAILEVRDERRPNNTVIEELRKGYTLNGVVIRPALVKVSRSDGGCNDTENEAEADVPENKKASNKTYDTPYKSIK